MLNLVKKERIAYFSVFTLTGSILAADRLTAFEIGSNILLFWLLTICLCALFLMVFQYLFGVLTKRFVVMLFVMIFGLCFGTALLTWNNTWKLQTIIYRNIKHGNRTIEYRMRADRFGSGFERQIIQRRKVFHLLDFIKTTDTTHIDTLAWKYVNEKINEMEFAGEYVDLPPSD